MGDDGWLLFKQTGELFKQITIEGRTIGVTYTKRGGTPTVFNYPQVQSQYRIYRQRAEDTASEANQVGYDKWRFIMTLFEEGREELALEDLKNELA